MTNPYRTVDWMPVDLTVFNGTDFNQQNGTHGWNTTSLSDVDESTGRHRCRPRRAYSPWDPDDPVSAADKLTASLGSAQGYDQNKMIRFASRQRGGNRNLVGLAAAPPPTFGR